MFVFNHIARTGGTFLLSRLRVSGLTGGPEISFGPARGVPRILCNDRHRPSLLVYHSSGREFVDTFVRHTGDFVFTFLRDRVDMAYSNFAYMKMRVERGDHIDGWTDQQHRYFHRSIEQHVDGLLTTNAPDREYPHRLDAYDFVGITEEMNRSLAQLGHFVGARIENGSPINSTPIAKQYRRDELEQLFAPQLALFREARARLLSLG